MRRGSRVRVQLNGSYRHYLDGLEGTVTAVYYHGAAVQLESPPVVLQKVMGAGGMTGPVHPGPPVYVFQFNELVVLS